MDHLQAAASPGTSLGRLRGYSGVGEAVTSHRGQDISTLIRSVLFFAVQVVVGAKAGRKQGPPQPVHPTASSLT